MRVKQPWELPAPQYALIQDVRKMLGEITAASLSCVLLDGALRFMAISSGEEAYIRQLAGYHGVSLPI